MPRGDWLCDPSQFAVAFQRREKLPQIGVLHIKKL
jgi:hypothetical protein